MSLHELPAAEHLRSLERAEITSVELTTAYLDRIEAIDPRVGAFLHVDREHALAQAADIDAKRAAAKP